MQAARGTPLTSADAAPGEDGPGEVTARSGSRRRAPYLGLLAVVAAAAYTLDVVTKVLAVERLDGTSNVPVVGDWLTLTLVRNPGAAFSTGTEFTVVLSVISITAALVVLWVARRVGSRWWAVGLGLLLAGVLGNLTDRMLRQPGPFEGHVIDFLRIPSWPVFNVADICINVAAGVIILQAFRGVRVDGTREGDHAARGDADEDADEGHAEAGADADARRAGERAE
ncbi:signal peptidase II [Nocardioides sp. CFH 31398]|uniref:signal peptidase II n=1 Tax=Nocardioides sp. CFH 31398 TaxID=2919579 RepID=UPI001F060414|nr:signal peptidase II [Nocardioides sp. CFH 31398]MCH1868289.1 signal peptidase II [Nocardioides sp. CFH 31398]